MIGLQRLAMVALLLLVSVGIGAVASAADQPNTAVEGAIDAPATDPGSAETAEDASAPECDKGISMSPDELLASLDAAGDC